MQQGSITRDELNALQHEIGIAASNAAAAMKLAEDTHALIQELHDALMKPAPGMAGKTLLDRMANVTITMESGYRVGTILVWGAGVLAAIGAFVALSGWLSPSP